MNNLNEFKLYLKHKKKYSDSTIQSIETFVLNYLIWIKSNNITVSKASYKDSIKYLSYLKREKHQKQYVASNIRAIKYYYEFKFKKKNPFSPINIQREKRDIVKVIPIETLNNIYDNYEKEQGQSEEIFIRNKAILSLLYFQYLTVNEVNDLSIEDIDLQKGVIDLKGNDRINKRNLPIANKQFYFLSEYLTHKRKVLLNNTVKNSNKLIISKGESNSVGNIVQMLFNKLNKNRVEKVNWTIIRQSLIVDLVKNENLRIAQYKLGHKYISSTERYKITDVEELKRKVITFHPF